MTEIARQGRPAALSLRRWSTPKSSSISHAHASRPREGAASGGVAYFTNVYPKISHSFIRTEIAALERHGLTVHRHTIRRSGERFEDPQDRQEAERTAVLLEDRIGLASAALACLLSRPVSSGAALALAWRSAGWKGLAYFAEAALLARRLRRLGVRHVHVHFGTNPASIARLAARIAPITYSFTAHGPDEFDDPRGLDLSGKIADAAFVAGVSSFGRGQLMRWADPSDWDRIHVVRCAASPAFLASLEPKTAVPQTPRFLCVARLSAQKGVPLLIEAFGKVAAHRPVALDLIGDGEDRLAIERQIALAGLQGRVRLLGWKSPEAIRSALRDAHALVLPSFAEGLPVVLMEAMACARPVIATAIAGIPELVDGRVGWLVPSGSSQAIAQAMTAALDASPEVLAEMGARGRQRVLDRHAPDPTAAELAALLKPYL